MSVAFATPPYGDIENSASPAAVLDQASVWLRSSRRAGPGQRSLWFSTIHPPRGPLRLALYFLLFLATMFLAKLLQGKRHPPSIIMTFFALIPRVCWLAG